MAKSRFIEIDGRRYLWRDILALRRAEAQKPPTAQPTLFAWQDDHRPPTSRKAADRYREPSLCTQLDDDR